MNPNDNTVYTNVGQGFENPQSNQSGVQPASFDPNQKKNDSNLAAKLGAGIVGGAALGAGVMYAGEAIANGINSGGEEEQAALADQAAENQGLQMAHVNDNMSFADAFEAARAEVGPGGVFIWRGGVYGTYSQDEWNAMSPEDRAAFTDNAMGQYGGQGATQTQSVQTEVHHVHHHHHHDTPATGNVIQDDNQQPDSIVGGGRVPSGGESSDDTGVRIIGTRTDVLDGETVNVADIEMDGHSGILIDVDRDGVYDIAGVDVDDSGSLEENEIHMLNEETSVSAGVDPDPTNVYPEEVQVIDTEDPVVLEDDVPTDQDDIYSDEFNGDYTADNGSEEVYSNEEIYVADNTSTDGMDDFVNDANVDMLA